MKHFFDLYEDLVFSCTSYMDAKENTYHMLFLGMCMTLQGAYKVTSNIEAGYGRSDIMLKSKPAGYPSIIVEFKQGENLETLKDEVLKQILDNLYESIKEIFKKPQPKPARKKSNNSKFSNMILPE